MRVRVERSAAVEDLIGDYPAMVGLMIRKGLPCFVCGEPTWGTLEEIARRSGKSEAEIDALVAELQLLTGGKER